MDENEAKTGIDADITDDPQAETEGGSSEQPSVFLDFIKKNEDLIIKAQAGRTSLFLIATLALANFLLFLLAHNDVISFTMTIPNVIVIHAEQMLQGDGGMAGAVLLYMLGVVLIAAMFAIWWISRKYTMTLAVFAGIYIVDTVVLLLMSQQLFPNLILDFAYHGWALYAIFSIFIRRRKLNRLWREASGSPDEWPADIRHVYGQYDRYKT